MVSITCKKILLFNIFTAIAWYNFDKVSPLKSLPLNLSSMLFPMMSAFSEIAMFFNICTSIKNMP